MSPPNKSIPRALSIAFLTMIFPIASLAGFKPGDNLPDLNGFQLEGKLPEDLKGQVILLDFWASWCGSCAQSFPAMDHLKNKYAEQGLTIVAVSIDEKPDNMRRFLESAKVSFTVVRDAQQKLVAAADIPAMPTSFLIDRSGKIHFIHAGFDRDKSMRLYTKEIEQLLQESKP